MVRISLVVEGGPELAVGELGDTGSDMVIEVERDGTIRYGFVDVVLWSQHYDILWLELGLYLLEEPIVRCKASNQDNVLSVLSCRRMATVSTGRTVIGL